MGMNIDCVCVYGVKYTYDEVYHILERDDIKKCIKELKAENYWPRNTSMMHVWSEITKKNLYLRVVSPYLDSCDKDCKYLIGLNVEKDMKLDDIINKKEEVESEIKEICKEYGLVEKKICFIYLPDIW